jgi:hypothetical protein
MKSKVVAFTEIQEALNADHGIPLEDSTNVFAKTKEVFGKIIRDNCDVTKSASERIGNLTVETPFGCYDFEYQDMIKGIDGEPDIPAQYTGAFGYTDWMINEANHSVDFGVMPTSAEINEMKKSA